MNIKSLIVQSHVHAYTVLGKQRVIDSYKTFVLIICIYIHIQKVIYQEVNSNICLLPSDIGLLFVSISGFALMYT